MKKNIIMLVTISLIASTIFAYTLILGGSNLGFTGYPKFSSMPPMRSYGMTATIYEYERYKDAVTDYVDDAQEYIDNCYEDIKRIQNEIKTTIDKANAEIEAYNSWLNRVEITNDSYNFL